MICKFVELVFTCSPCSLFSTSQLHKNGFVGSEKSYMCSQTEIELMQTNAIFFFFFLSMISLFVIQKEQQFQITQHSWALFSFPISAISREQNLCHLPSMHVLSELYSGKFLANEIEDSATFPKVIIHLFLSILFYHITKM